MSLTPIATRMLDFHRDLLRRIQGEAVGEGDVEHFRRLQSLISKRARDDQLDPRTRQIAFVVSQNIQACSEMAQRLAVAYQAELQGLSTEMESLLLVDSGSHVQDSCRQSSAAWPSDRIPQRSDSAISLCPPSSNSRPVQSLPRSSLELSLAREPSDHIREWFLCKLTNPYPTAAEKDHLSDLTGIPRSKIDSDLTNWRRRAGWTDIKDKFANKDREAMRKLIIAVQGGREGREEVVAAVEKMRSYLTKEKEWSAGSWIKNLKPAISDKDLSTGKKRQRTDKTTSTTPAKKQLYTPPASAVTSPETPTSRVTRSTRSQDAKPIEIISTSPSTSTSTSRSVFNSSSSTSYTFDFKPYSYNPISTPSDTTTTTTSLLGTKRSNESLWSVEEPNTKPRLDAYEYPSFDDAHWLQPVQPIHTTSPDQYVLLPSSTAPPYASGPPSTWFDGSIPMPPLLPHMQQQPSASGWSLPEQFTFSFSSSVRGP